MWGTFATCRLALRPKFARLLLLPRWRFGLRKTEEARYKRAPQQDKDRLLRARLSSVRSLPCQCLPTGQLHLLWRYTMETKTKPRKKKDNTTSEMIGTGVGVAGGAVAGAAVGTAVTPGVGTAV